MDIMSMYPEYLRHFNRDDYRETFGRFKTEYSGFFEEISSDNKDEKISGIMDFAAKELRRKLGRKPRCFDLRSFLCVYLCPAAIDCGTLEARCFASELAERWSKEYPEFGFEAGCFEDIASGFRTKPFGF